MINKRAKTMAFFITVAISVGPYLNCFANVNALDISKLNNSSVNKKIDNGNDKDIKGYKKAGLKFSKDINPNPYGIQVKGDTTITYSYKTDDKGIGKLYIDDNSDDNDYIKNKKTIKINNNIEGDYKIIVKNNFKGTIVLNGVHINSSSGDIIQSLKEARLIISGENTIKCNGCAITADKDLTISGCDNNCEKNKLEIENIKDYKEATINSSDGNINIDNVTMNLKGNNAFYAGAFKDSSGKKLDFVKSIVSVESGSVVFGCKNEALDTGIDLKSKIIINKDSTIDFTNAKGFKNSGTIINTGTIQGCVDNDKNTSTGVCTGKVFTYCDIVDFNVYDENNKKIEPNPFKGQDKNTYNLNSNKKIKLSAIVQPKGLGHYKIEDTHVINKVGFKIDKGIKDIDSSYSCDEDKYTFKTSPFVLSEYLKEGNGGIVSININKDNVLDMGGGYKLNKVDIDSSDKAIINLNPSGGGGGGDNTPTDNTSFEQIVGKDRFETADKISDKIGSASTAILTGENAVSDSMTATPFAYRQKAPILLTGKDKLNDMTKAQLKN